jgi:uncharacterized membrane protein YdfJ with MMPL/SSD domain
VAAHPLLVLAVWVAGAVGVTLLVHEVGADTDNAVDLPGTGSQAATDLLQAGFPPQQNGTNPVIFHVTDGKVTDKANKSAITNSYKAIKKIPYVHSANSPFSQGGSGQISKDKKTAFVAVLLDISSNDLTTAEAQRVLDAAKPARQAGMEVVGGGSIATVLSPNDTSVSDLIGILAAMIILTFTFGTVVAMGMPIGTAIVGLTSALAVIGLLGHVFSVPDISHTVATMIGLAVGIDYALFLVTRHTSQMRAGVELHESIARAVGTAGTAVVFAGCTVVVALVSLQVAGIPLVAALGYTSAIAVATAVLAAVTLLPALMSLAGRHINSLALPGRSHPSEVGDTEGLWGHWARFVTRVPLIPVALAALILVPLIIPVLSLQFGQENVGQTDPATMERRAYDLMANGYGPGYNGPLLVAVALTPPAKSDPTVLAQENQLKQLQKELEAEQKQGQQMKAQLESGQAQLQKQQLALEQKQSTLERQSAALKRQQASLEAQQASLEAQAAQLRRQRDTLRAEAEALAANVRRDAGRLVAIRAEERRVKRKLRHTSDRRRRARLIARLQRLQAAEQQTIADLKRSRREAESLLRQARALDQQAQALERQKQQLQAQAAQLQTQADALQRQAAALQRQATALQAQAAQLQQQKAQLEALQAKADKQQKQANALHNQLVQTLTKAGGDARGTDPRLVELQDALIAAKGVKLVVPPQISKHGDDVVYSVIATTAPSAPATADLVRHLRSTVIPANTSKGVVAYVGGSTAANVDLASEISTRLPLVIATILLLSMLVLLVAFRSVLIPIQAAVTNFLAAMAAFGILTAAFQWGWGIDVVRIHTDLNTVPIASYVPLMMFAVLFGLSMDYQVFLLSSVDHHRAAGETDRASVRLGLKSSARVISAAALIMISVFSSFILNGDPVVKQFGVGLSSAVLLAATLVLMLAPAVLTLLGRAAWWMPAVLARIIPVVDIEGTSLPVGGAPVGTVAEPELTQPEPVPLPADNPPTSGPTREGGTAADATPPEIVSAARSNEQDVVKASDSGKGWAARGAGDAEATPPIPEAERGTTETREHAPAKDPAHVGDAPPPPDAPR